MTTSGVLLATVILLVALTLGLGVNLWFLLLALLVLALLV